uniref:Peptidase M12B domain-containing protein n=1 Tax=Ascaris lumbricoides TaxID=6252 RepID=A0A9J2Q3M3_ASCLU
MKPSNEHGTLTVASSVPDWKAVTTDGRIRYIETLLIVDSDVLRFYGRDMKKLRRAVKSLMQALDLYLYQIDLRIIVVDIIELNVHNVTLEYMVNYRSEKYAHLPEHDLAILISNAYEGGIAYVNGICSRSAVGIIGFFADAPMEYASIFFHELAHLLGLSHDALVSCACNSIDSDEGCLKIDGFDYDCSVQALVEKLPEHICIQSPPQSVPKTALAVCGNQIVEQHEECDCGPERDTPTFMPLVGSLSDSRAPIWNASMLSDDNSNFTTPQSSPVKLLVSPTDSTSKRDSYLPPIPPRLVNYVNITQTKSIDNLPQVGIFFSSSTLLNKAETLDRNTRRMTTTFHQQDSTSERDSYLPPIPPRLVNYVNITQTKSIDNLPQVGIFFSSSTLLNKAQTLDRNTRRMTTTFHQQSLTPSLSSFKSDLPLPKSLQPNYALYCESNNRIVTHPSEVKGNSLNRTNPTQRRLVFSTDSSQEISTHSTSNTKQINTHPTALDEYIQIPKTPEKERQHQELINALSQCLLIENGNIRRPLQPKRLFGIPPTDHNHDDTNCQPTTSSSSSENLYDVPIPREHKATLIASESSDCSNENLVKLSFKQPTNRKSISGNRRCQRSHSFNEKPTSSSIKQKGNEKAAGTTCESKMIDPTENVGCATTKRRPKIPPPPPPPPPHSTKRSHQMEIGNVQRPTTMADTILCG